MSGTALRINQLLNPTHGTSIVVAFDHGYNGEVPGGENAPDIIARMAKAQIDGILIGPGLLRQLAPLLAHPGAPRIIATLDGGTWGPLPGAEGFLTHHRRAISPATALRYGAVAAKMILPLGMGDSKKLADATSLLGSTAEECDALGLPFVIEPAFWGEYLEGGVTDQMIRHAARQSIELGATILKLPAPSHPDVLAEIVANAGVPVLVLGGAQQAGGDIGETIVAWMNAGAAGVAIGRNVWGRPDMDTAIAGLRAAVYDRDAAQAKELFRQADQS
ncbi:MAG: hypothetical protein QM628_08320 [Propionicimonas sp.]